MKTISRFRDLFFRRADELKSNLLEEAKVKKENGDEWEYIKRKIGTGIVDAYAETVDAYAKETDNEKFSHMMNEFHIKLTDSWEKNLSIADAHHDFEEAEKIKVKLYYSESMFNAYKKIWKNIKGDEK